VQRIPALFRRSDMAPQLLFDSRMMRFAGLLLLLSCSGSHSNKAPCTPVDQDVHGTALTFTTIDVLATSSVSCNNLILTSSADVALAFPNGDAPPEVAQADFNVDRVFLSSSNPAVMFVVDDGTQLQVGEEQLCQGAAPRCTAHVVHATTRNTFRQVSCPYTGPDPCLAP
jgi:hypothetical protein